MKLMTLANEGHCPICDSDIGFRKYIEWHGHRWVICRHCGGGHKEPYIPETEDASIAEERYQKEYFESEFFARRVQFAENQARWLKANFREGMAVVEIGPGLGLAAERFLQLIPGTPYHALETHPTFADFIRKRLGNRIILHDGRDPARGLRGALEQAAAGDRPVLVYLDNVLEHIAGPRDFVCTLKSVLPRGSRALFDVPNERGLKYRVRIYEAIGGRTTMGLGHVNLFTKASVCAMLKSLDLRHVVRQRGIRRREEVNCLPEGLALDLVLRLLHIFPIDTILGIANNLRIEVEF